MIRKSKKKPKTPVERLFKEYYRPILNDQVVKKVRAYKVRGIAFMLQTTYNTARTKRAVNSGGAL